MNTEQIISILPYDDPFLFVDEIEEVQGTGVRGNYTFPKNSFFYKGHFKNNPITPGVILTECCAQIGLVSLGIFLIGDESRLLETKIALVQSTMEFFEPVLPGEKVVVQSKKLYYRFGKLKCKVMMQNVQGVIVCSGELSGMIYDKRDE
ncbi:beta-hydroxyacyl-ACP dehydratase [Dokdonia sinensis]|uniref:Beta-hydroxyacyl-ACP dehydratase n=1 Tax=Dokdonia sinensis TaxID=2479847 RepID=A0A3M0G7K7_9FLAO|nr:3-hydroxyacyl-ACP dehydratase FabZ family protein [Dokdonia sinensis]RMB61020.1 beta-hydroxyacyl-ACP dehydratase [Dokdonia sinensis]